jgi:hypothetical protein
MPFTEPVSPSVGQLVTGDGAGGTFSWDAQVRDNFKAVQRLLNRDVTQQESSNTTSEVTIYTFAVPANTLGTDKVLRLEVQGDLLNNTGATVTWTIRVKWGGTTIASFAPTNVTTSAARRAWWLSVKLAAGNATNVQRAMTRIDLSEAHANGTVTGPNLHTVLGRHDALAVDSTAQQTLEVTVQHSAAGLNYSTIMQAATLELLP